MSALIQAAPVQRDEDGFWFHPQMPSFDEGQEAEWKAWLAAQGLTTATGMLEHEDCDHPVYVAYFDKGEPSFLGWIDSPPDGDGWFTLCVTDTEDGPAWLWARRTETENTGAAA